VWALALGEALEGLVSETVSERAALGAMEAVLEAPDCHNQRCSDKP